MMRCMILGCLSVMNVAMGQSPLTEAAEQAVRKRVIQAMKEGNTPGAVLWVEHGGKAAHWAQGSSP
jgi:hypothetical protein